VSSCGVPLSANDSNANKPLAIVVLPERHYGDDHPRATLSATLVACTKKPGTRLGQITSSGQAHLSRRAPDQERQISQQHRALRRRHPSPRKSLTGSLSMFLDRVQVVVNAMVLGAQTDVVDVQPSTTACLEQYRLQHR